MAEEKEKRPKGRWGMYRDWITKEGLLIIQGWARDGLSNKQIAKNIGITEGTLYEWKHEHSDFSEALKKGKEVIDREVENALLNKALEGDGTSMIFWLKNRKPDEWNDRRHIEHSGGLSNTNVNMFKDITTEELKRLANEIDEDVEDEETDNE